MTVTGFVIVLVTPLLSVIVSVTRKVVVSRGREVVPGVVTPLPTPPSPKSQE